MRLGPSRRPGARFSRRSPGGAGGGVTPLTILGSLVRQWCRADLGVTIGTGASALADQSGNTKNYTQGTAAFQPAVTASDATLSGLQTISFDGSNDTLVSALAMAPPYFVFCVFKVRTWVNVTHVYGDNVADAARLFMSGASPTLTQRNGVSSNSSNGGTVGSWVRSRDSVTNATTDYLKVGAAANVTGVAAGAGSGAALALGSTQGGFFGAIDFREIIVCSSEPNAGQLASMDAYFAAQSGSIIL